MPRSCENQLSEHKPNYSRTLYDRVSAGSIAHGNSELLAVCALLAGEASVDTVVGELLSRPLRSEGG